MSEFDKDLENYFCRFTFGQFVTLILLEIVTLFFVFYLGAHYGPELMGRGAGQANKASLLPPDDSKKVEDILSNPPTDYSYPKTLSDHGNSEEGLSKAVRVKPSGMTAKEADQLIKKGAPTPPPPELVKEAPAQPADGGEPVAPSEESLASPPAPPHDETPPPSQPPAAKETSSGQFAIQVASYATEDEAKKTVAKWKHKGYSAYTTEGEVAGRGTWHRVRIGRFKSRQEADTYLEKLKSTEKVSALVVSTKS